MQALPVPHQLVDEVVDLALVADVDAARRLVDDDHRRVGQHDLGQQQLLLVAARKLARRRAAGTRTRMS